MSSQIPIPIGVFFPSPPEYYEDLVNLGINTVISGKQQAICTPYPYSTSQVLESAARNGLKVIIDDGGIQAMLPIQECGYDPNNPTELTLHGKNLLERAVVSVIERNSAHPATKGYYICDEPTVNDARYLVSHVADFFRKHDPGHEIFSVLTPRGDWENYQRLLEILKLETLFIDPYPFQKIRKDYELSHYEWHINFAREVASRNRVKLFVTLQAFCHDEGGIWNYAREPNEEEFNNAVDIAMKAQPEGIFYFLYSSFNTGNENLLGIVDRDFRTHRQLYHLVQRTNQRIRVKK